MIAYIAICICDGYFSNPAELTDYFHGDRDNNGCVRSMRIAISSQ